MKEVIREELATMISKHKSPVTQKSIKRKQKKTFGIKRGEIVMNSMKWKKGKKKEMTITHYQKMEK